MKKQAQQPPSYKGLGIRPLDAPVSRDTRKLEGSSKGSSHSGSFPAISGNRHRLGKCDYIRQTDNSIRCLQRVPCDADSLTTSHATIHTETALPASSSSTRTNPKFSMSGDCAAQSSGASRPGSLFQSAQNLSAHILTGLSLSGSFIADKAPEHSPLLVPTPAIHPQHQSPPTGRPPHRRQDISSTRIDQMSTSVHDVLSVPLRTCLPLETHAQVSTALTSLQASTHMQAPKSSAIETMRILHDSGDELNAFTTKNSQGTQITLRNLPTGGCLLHRRV